MIVSKSYKILLFLLVFSFSISSPAFTFKDTEALSGSEFQPGRIIDDSKFFAAPNMSIADIQNFLNSKVPVCDTWGAQPYAGTTRAAYAASRGVSTPFTCLKDYRDTLVPKSAETNLCNGMFSGTGTAAEIIYWVSTSCGINPQALIVLLQKEQSLITDDWPWPVQYRSATGYGCPDTAPCDSEYYGFFNQVYNAARQFKKYARDSSNYSHRAYVNNYVRFNPNAACGGSTVYIENQATAGLYNYTPYQPNQPALNNLYGTGDGCSAYGNRNFWRMFNDWFGSTLGPVDYSCVPNGANITGAGTGERIIGNKKYAGGEVFTKILLNETGTGCTETHTWSPSLTSWFEQKASNRRSIDPANSDIITMDSNGNKFDELALVEYRETGSNRIEFHLWDSTYQRWKAHIASVSPTVDPAATDIISADLNGDGKDEVLLIKYIGTASGKIEVHGWTHDFQGWFLHAATNHPTISKAGTRVVAADYDGDGKDELLLVRYTGTASGKIEVHGWTHNLKGWFLQRATNHTSVNPGSALVTPSDRNGVGRDEIYLVKYRNTSSGRQEVHGWSYDLRSWVLHSTLAP